MEPAAGTDALPEHKFMCAVIRRKTFGVIS